MTFHAINGLTTNVSLQNEDCMVCLRNTWLKMPQHIQRIDAGIYRKTSNIRRTLVGNEIVDHSDVVGASPVGAAPTTSSFST